MLSEGTLVLSEGYIGVILGAHWCYLRGTLVLSEGYIGVI